MAESRSAKSIAMGVLPAPPSTRLPTQITGTPGANGRTTRRRKAPAAPNAQPNGVSRVASRPSRCQNSGAESRIGVETVEPGGETIEQGVEDVALTLGDGGGGRGSVPALVGLGEKTCQRAGQLLRVPYRLGPARRAQSVADRRGIGHIGAQQNRAVEQRCLERVVTAKLRGGTADEGDAGDPVEEPQLAQRIREVDVGRIGDLFAPRPSR